MHLTALELHGFKSFPDKTRLLFGNGITCVVGPNGSGKSNVSDAIRWVLGEQSSRQLRGTRMEDVIFSGTNQRKSQNVAEVTLFLENSSRDLRVESDSVAVTRRLYRSGDSEYLINNKISRLKDVHELFMDTGLGRDGYSLVGQGCVADLVSPRSSQRREMLEEASGIAQSRYRRAVADQKLKQSEENLVRLRDILGELEVRIEPLLLQKEKAEAFLRLSGEQKRLEIGLSIHTIQMSKKALREQDHRITKAQTEYHIVMESISNLEKKINSYTSEIELLTLELDDVRKQNSQYEEKILLLEGEIKVLKNTVSLNQSTISRLKHDCEVVENTQEQFFAEERLLLSKKEKFRQKLFEKEEFFVQFSEKFDFIRANLLSVQTSYDMFFQKLTQLNDSMLQKKITQTETNSVCQELILRIQNLQSQISLKTNQIEEIENSSYEADRSLQIVRAHIEKLRNRIQLLQEDLKKSFEKVRSDQEVLNHMSNETQQKSSRHTLLQELRQNMEGYHGSVRAILRNAQKGVLQGIHGALADLLTTETQYTIAIETALGAALQYIVTDTEQHAKHAIDFLAKSRAGRATFLPISAIKSTTFHQNELQNCQGFISIADQLLQFKSIYRDIFRAQLGKTIIVDQMEHALSIAKQFHYRFRIVTLDGQIIHSGGSMTGGSKSHNVGIISRGNEISLLEKELFILKKNENDQILDLKKSQDNMTVCESELLELQNLLAKELETVAQQESFYNSLQIKQAQMHLSREELQEELDFSKKRLKKLSAETQEAGELYRTTESEILEVKEMISQISLRQDHLSSEIQEYSQNESNLQLELLSLRKDIQASDEKGVTIVEQKKEYLDRKERLIQEMNLLSGQNIHAEEEIVKATELVENLLNLRSEMEKKCILTQSKREEISIQIDTFRREERVQLSEKERLSRELARQEERRLTAQQGLEQTAALLFEQHELTPREAESQGFSLDHPEVAVGELNEVNTKIRMLGTINVHSIEEFRELQERYLFLRTQLEDADHSRAELINMIEELTEEMSKQFSKKFLEISRYFRSIFSDLFQGGQAELFLENPNNCLESAVELRVQPPGKNIQNIDLLSGGEKGLSAIAFLFAILRTNPAPFCVFDEVEAALDDINVTRYARYVRRMTRDTQFILITHRRGTMEEADVLYGVTMQEEGVSKILEMKTSEISEKFLENERES